MDDCLTDTSLHPNTQTIYLDIPIDSKPANGEHNIWKWVTNKYFHYRGKSIITPTNKINKVFFDYSRILNHGKEPDDNDDDDPAISNDSTVHTNNKKYGESELDDINFWKQFLDIIVPLSPKACELKERIDKEFKDASKIKNKTTDEIDLIKKQIKQEIDFKYNTFDANELNTFPIMNSNGEYKSNYKYASPITQLSFDNCNCDIATTNVMEFLNKELTQQRIQNGLANLKSLTLRRWNCYFGVVDNGLVLFYAKLLNSISNQLESLHTTDDMNLFEQKWLFAQTVVNCDKTSLSDSPRIEEQQRTTWYPANLTHLCLYSNSYSSSTKHLWHHVSAKTFHKLQHLTINNLMDAPNTEIITQGLEYNLHLSDSNNECNVIDNIASLVGNGLTSLQFRFRLLTKDNIVQQPKIFWDDWGLRHVVQQPENYSCTIQTFLNFMSKVFERLSYTYIEPISDNVDKKKNYLMQFKKSDHFALKMAFQVKVEITDDDCESGCNRIKLGCLRQELIYICKELCLLYSGMLHCFENYVMLCFKIEFQVSLNETDAGKVMSVLDTIANKKSMLLSSDDTKAVDSSVKMTKYKRSDKATILFGVVIKSKNKGKANLSCPMGHCEPKFEFECKKCEHFPWLRVW